MGGGGEAGVAARAGGEGGSWRGGGGSRGDVKALEGLLEEGLGLGQGGGSEGHWGAEFRLIGLAEKGDDRGVGRQFFSEVGERQGGSGALPEGGEAGLEGTPPGGEEAGGVAALGEGGGVVEGLAQGAVLGGAGAALRVGPAGAGAAEQQAEKGGGGAVSDNLVKSGAENERAKAGNGAVLGARGRGQLGGGGGGGGREGRGGAEG